MYLRHFAGKKVYSFKIRMVNNKVLNSIFCIKLLLKGYTPKIWSCNFCFTMCFVKSVKISIKLTFKKINLIFLNFLYVLINVKYKWVFFFSMSFENSK